MLIVDWFMWQLLRDRNFLDSEQKNTLSDKLTTPTNRFPIARGLELSGESSIVENTK